MLHITAGALKGLTVFKIFYGASWQKISVKQPLREVSRCVNLKWFSEP